MTTLKKYILILTMFCFLSGLSSCLIFETSYTTRRHDNGNHNGWYKNPHNPHNPHHHHHKKHGNGHHK